MAKKAPSLARFMARFPDEATCAEFLFRKRWPAGFVCPACGSLRASALKSRAHTYECRDCGRQTSITAGTVMHRTKLPLTVWFQAAHLMATHSNGFSARQLREQIDVTYKTAWLLEQKLRRSMVDPDRTRLSGVVEIDQTEVPFRETQTFYDPNRSGKIIIIGAVEVIDRASGTAPRPKRKGALYHDTRAGRLRLAVIPDNTAASIKAFIRANVEPGATVITDGHRSYLNLSGYRHDPHVVTNIPAHVPLRWIHVAFALMKRWGLGTYHGLRRKHIDTYLNEFVFRFNRRYHRQAAFETLLGLASEGRPRTYWEIAGRENPRKGTAPRRLTPRHRKTAFGKRQDPAPNPVEKPQRFGFGSR